MLFVLPPEEVVIPAAGDFPVEVLYQVAVVENFQVAVVAD
jgi:hypothetical protein